MPIRQLAHWVLFMAAALFAHPIGGTVAFAADGSFVLARVNENPARTIPRMEPLARWLAPRLAPEVSRVELRVVPTLGQLLDLMGEGKVDLVSETPFGALALEEMGGRIVMREWRGGQSRYHTVFFAKTDAPITSLSDLNGRKIAFEDPGSTSAFMLPYAEIRRAGLATTALPTIRGAAPAQGVGYGFLRGETNIPLSLLSGLADAGAFANTDWAELEREQPAIAQQLRIFHRTADVTRSLIVVNGRLSDALTDRLVTALAGIADDPAGRDALREFSRGTQLDRIDDAVSRELEDARVLYRGARDTLLAGIR